MLEFPSLALLGWIALAAAAHQGTAPPVSPVPVSPVPMSQVPVPPDLVSQGSVSQEPGPRELARELTGDRHVARYAPDGRLVVVLRDMAEASPTRGDWLLWVGRYADLAAGRPGEFRVRLADNQNAWDSSYSGLELFADGTFVATTYGHWDEGAPPYVVSARFTPLDLEALRGATAR